MSLDTVARIDRDRNFYLVRIMEKAWPGCGAHVKRNQTTGKDEVIWSQLLTAALRAEIAGYVQGWNASMDAAREMLVAALPFPEDASNARRGPSGPRKPAAPPSARRDRSAATAARAGLDALFSGGDQK